MAVVLRAWRDLDSCRPITPYPKAAGDSVVYVPVRGSIPYTAIVEWADVEGLDYESFSLLLSVIARLDGERMERIQSELNRGS